LAVRLKALLGPTPDELWSIRPDPPQDLEVGGICHDSRVVQPGDLFCALPGRVCDGSHFVEDAYRRGASAFLVEGDQRPGGVNGHLVLNARSARRAMGHLAALIHGEPSRALRVIGVTGTDGKTSTAWLLRHILSADGRCAVAAGTLGIKGDGDRIESWDDRAQAAEAHRTWHPTTPESPVFQRALARLRDRGVQDVVVEVSSHALDQDRVYGTQFRAVALTHVSTDHLDFHGSREAYIAAKMRLFDSATRGGALERDRVIEVLNADDAVGRLLIARAVQTPVRFGHRSGCEVRLEKMTYRPDGMELAIEFTGRRVSFSTPLAGRFHSANLLSAAAIAFAVGVRPEAITSALASAPIIPGRFEAIREGQPFAVIVDYAHTTEALRRLLEAARDLGRGRILLVFGCGGDRDREKRAPMGRVAGELAEHIILTNDNPRSEDPEGIAHQVRGGTAAGTWEVVLDRRCALRRAVEIARPGDIVVVAGKGAEGVQVFNNRVEPFDDRQVLRELLREGHPVTGTEGDAP